MFTKANKITDPRLTGSEIISIEKLYEIITTTKNPTIDKMRSLGKSNPKYSSLKNSLPFIFTHGIFTSLKKDSLVKLGGYIFFDIDDIGDTVYDLKEFIINNIKPSLICISSSGLGLSIFFKVNGLDKDNFDFCYDYIYNVLVNKGLNIDKGAGGLVRKLFISYDEQAYLNTSNVFNIDLKNIRGSLGIKEVEDKEYLPYVPLNKSKIDIIPLKDLLKDINIKTIYDKEIIGNYNIDKVDGYVSIFLIKDLKDGMKRKTFTRIAIQLIYLNNNITLEEVFSFIFWYNNYLKTKKMEIWELEKLVKFIYKENIDKPKDELNIVTRTKKIFFAQDTILTASDKQSIGAKVNGILRSNKTKDTITEAIDKLNNDKIKITKKNISLITGLSIQTIKRNWTKEKKDPNLYK